MEMHEKIMSDYSRLKDKSPGLISKLRNPAWFFYSMFSQEYDRMTETCIIMFVVLITIIITNA